MVLSFDTFSIEIKFMDTVKRDGSLNEEKHQFSVSA